jgi:hypothetical protein
MGLKDLLDFSQTLVVFKDHILILLALIAIVVFVGWKSRGLVDDGEIRGVKAENNALKEQLNLAHNEQNAITKQSTKLELEVAQLRVEFASMKASLLPTVTVPQLDKVAVTAAVVSDTVSLLRAATLSLESYIGYDALPLQGFKSNRRSE